MNCQVIHPRLQDYAEGLLSPGEATRVESHLARCPGCRLEVALARRIETALSARVLRMPPQDFTASLLASLPARPIAVSFRSQALSLAGYLAAALAAIVGYQRLGPWVSGVYGALSDRISILSLVLGFQSPETAGEPGWLDLLFQEVRDRAEDLVAYLTVFREQVNDVYNSNTTAVQISFAALVLIWAVYDHRRQRAKTLRRWEA